MKKILIILFVLIVILTALSLYWKANQTKSKDLILTSIEGDEILINPANFRGVEFSTKKGDKFTGWPLTGLIEANNLTLDNAKSITLFSRDGGQITLENSEFTSAYIVSQSKDNEKFLRLIIPQDDFSQRWIKFINKIKIN